MRVREGGGPRRKPETHAYPVTKTVAPAGTGTCVYIYEACICLAPAHKNFYEVGHGHAEVVAISAPVPP
jgi:hypothetical protein